jgi:transcriptional regulator with XRE-family HTH domain
MKSAIDLFVINKVKEKRKELNISQRGIADILGCSAGFIGEVESDNYVTKYSVHQLFLIAKEFECSLAEFFPPLDSDQF